ncbi:MAG: serine/threonine protein kinase, partial [Acidimicrobiales bacterium]|nr:serine/threonine protein kinase [Acidimicrobiales bacterium]
RRQVALKVLQRSHVTPDSQGNFEHEANTMAEVSEHSNIVKIHASGVAPLPDGRPYIVMEFCPGERFDLRSRGGHLGVAIVLDTAIQIASAVETAHRANIFHRDLKPENILTTRSNKPALTDFGISAVRREGAGQGAAGYTPQFAPPEVIRDPYRASDASLDIYSLGATVFYLLEGRAPYFVHGADNSREAIEARTCAGPVPRIEREDVPPELRNLIANAMAHDPAHRPVSAIGFAQALQDVQQHLHLPVTATEVFDVTPLLEDFIPPTSTHDSWGTGGAEATRTGNDRAPGPPPDATGLPGSAFPAPSDNATVAGRASQPVDNATIAGQAPPPVAPPAPPPPPATDATIAGAAVAPPSDMTMAGPATPAPAPTGAVAPGSVPTPAPASVRPTTPAASVKSTPGAGTESTGAAAPADRRKLPTFAIAGLVVLVAVIAAAAVLGSGLLGGGSDDTTTTTGDTVPPVVGTVVPPPTDVEVVRDGGVPTASWTASDGDDISGYRVQVFDASSGTLEPTDLDGNGATYFDVDAGADSAPLPVAPDGGVGTYCIQVYAMSGSAISDAAPATPTCTSP